MNEDELLPLLKQLAEGVLRQKQVIEDLKARVARLEHLVTFLERDPAEHGGRG